ncbi:CDP-glycerol glycerophosphotransferase family protein [Pseudoalteromonas tunicata]|jgi:hypothetical protein|uniref:CDP-glycerol:poly(Glycerophosphate) glycerophosphotransferase n=1 Tax=Pseudoalteromonas tunicata D2 TaxID=87626 RepID=A4CBY4_9GAMM|nr:CDP-glycerol glycerophosphotransferase family protein [Pseudoalteromonas tunicata]ATC94422.1 hypothetical protein PTUN_a1849 [Pseudoalteromonas tunicata]AXT30154.1 CDP-glycerol--poly(glycerophosphate) glycerophosphotransferase [Pseudoalteromonas tunicata]EAR27871.1 hypothetical protein PTD2_18655 [Pseudoalteromonas tunicata D2]
MTVIFDIQHLYYLPQYLPVLAELTKHDVACRFVFYRQAEAELQKVCEEVIANEQLDAVWVDNWSQALAHYTREQADWLVFGNAVNDLDQLHRVSKTVLMQHGIGPKQCYYDVSANPTTVRFVEGQHRLKRLQALYPNSNFVDTGFAKLDPAFNAPHALLTLEALGLDPAKPTLLYAPTFYPSSIECFAKTFAQDFSEFNIIVKPHFFSLSKDKYHKQRRLLQQWAQAKNVYLAPVSDYNLLPFMALSDVMISDASSAIFEFAALNKPVVWCDFYKLRWSYRGIFSFRFKQRLNDDIEFFHQITERVEHYQGLKQAVTEAFREPNKLASKRIEMTAQLAGATDGQVSKRIAEYLIANT